MVENGSLAQFRDSVSGAPEFTTPFKADTYLGIKYWPFQEATPDGADDKIVFEAHNDPFDEAGPLLVRVSYEAPYGLKVKRVLVYRQFSTTDHVLEDAKIMYSFGEVEISLHSHLRSPLVSEGFLRDPNSFNTSILVQAAGEESVPPLAQITYDWAPQVPINAEFSCADYQQALRGEAEKRDKQEFRQAGYRKTYFEWVHLIGARVGIARYDDPVDADNLKFYQWRTDINGRQPTSLKDSPYKAKISRSRSEWSWGNGRLRFSRMNEQTGESWMLSAPEWVSKSEFHGAIETANLADFLYRYPVVFCVKSRGEDRKWFSTFYTNDKARR